MADIVTGRLTQIAMRMAWGAIEEHWREVKSQRAHAAAMRVFEELYILQELSEHPVDGAAVRALVEAAPELTFEYIRADVDALGEEARPFLALLTAEYLMTCRPRDRFFRRATIMLRDSSDEDVRGLVALAQMVKELGGAELAQAKSVTLRAEPTSNLLWLVAPYLYMGDPGPLLDDRREGAAPEGWAQAFNTLRRGGFAEDASAANYLDHETGHHVLVASPAHLDDFRRLVALLCRVPAA